MRTLQINFGWKPTEKLMWKYGSKIVLPAPLPPSGSTLLFNTDGFYLLYAARSFDGTIRDNWQQGYMRYGLQKAGELFFFLVDINHWRFNIGVNALQLSQSSAFHNWLSGNDNTLIFLLVTPSATSRVKAVRKVELHPEVAAEIRQLMKAQLNAYTDSRHINIAYAQIAKKVQPEEMVETSFMVLDYDRM